MSEQYLDGSQVACRLVDQRRLGSAQGVGAILLRRQADSRHPLIDEPCVSAGAQVTIRSNPTWEGKVIDRFAASFEPGEQAGPCVGSDFKLNGSTRLLLDHHRSGPDDRSSHQGADLDLQQVAASKLAVDRQIEEGSVSQTSSSVEKEADRPEQPDLQSALGANLPADIPSRSSCCCRVMLRNTHHCSTLAEMAREETKLGLNRGSCRPHAGNPVS